MLKNSRKSLTSCFSFYILFALATSISSPAMAQNSGGFCIATLNIYGTVYSGDRTKRMKAITEYVKENPCDVWAFQELWLEPDIKNFREALGQTSPSSYFVTGSTKERNGLALLSNYLLTETKVVIFDKNYSGFFDFFRKIFGVKKGYLVSTRRMGAAGKIHFVTTHMHHMNEGVRESQLNQLLEYLKSIPQDESIVLAGDLNFEPNTKLYNRLLEQGFKDSFANRTDKDCSYCGNNPYGWTNSDRFIDYVFYRPSQKLNFTVKEVEITGKHYGGQILSDHYVVRVLFGWHIKKAPSGG